jgi:hypothetical protein
MTPGRLQQNELRKGKVRMVVSEAGGEAPSGVGSNRPTFRRGQCTVYSAAVLLLPRGLHQ